MWIVVGDQVPALRAVTNAVANRYDKTARNLLAAAIIRLNQGHAQYICWPPLIDRVEPVMKPASSAIRNITPRAISSALPSRPTGILATIFSSTLAGTAATMSVSV